MPLTTESDDEFDSASSYGHHSYMSLELFLSL